MKEKKFGNESSRKLAKLGKRDTSTILAISLLTVGMILVVAVATTRVYADDSTPTAFICGLNPGGQPVGFFVPTSAVDKVVAGLTAAGFTDIAVNGDACPT